MSNNRFTPVADPSGFYKNEILKFTSLEPEIDQPVSITFKTLFGYTFAHNGVIWKNDNVSLSLALYRHTCVRCPETPGYDSALRIAQTNYLTRHPKIHSYITSDLALYEPLPSMRELAVHTCTLPHAKRKLRQDALAQLQLSDGIGEAVWCRSVEWKMKTGEYAKPGKIPRIIVDIGVSGSLQGSYWADLIKHYFGDRDIVMNDGIFRFETQPHPDKVMAAFERILKPTLNWSLTCFSDDAIYSQQRTSFDYCNLDVSSCDSSHTPELFESMFDAFSIPDDIRDALKGQIMAPIRIHDTNSKKKTTLTLRPRGFYLQSGITITTLLNVYAWYCIAHHHAEHTKATIIDSATALGYIVTQELCEQPEDLQFLKLSPTLDNTGTYRAMLNLGVIIRASGVCKGDLPGRGCILTRAADFQSSLMNGLLASIDYPPLSKLNPKTHSNILDDYSDISGSLHHTKAHLSVRHSYHRDSFYTRYKLTTHEIDELENLISLAAPGTTIWSSAASKILLKDYGLSVPIS